MVWTRTGSCTIEISYKDEKKEQKTLVFSGDIGNACAPIIEDPETPPKADYLVIEGTYGGRSHGPPAERKSQLKKALLQTIM